MGGGINILNILGADQNKVLLIIGILIGIVCCIIALKYEGII